MYLLLLLLACFPWSASPFTVEILESTENGTCPFFECEAEGANFGADINAFKSIGCAVWTEDDACHDHNFSVNSTLSCDNYFAVVPSANCCFSKKAYNVQEASPLRFNALIVYNDPGLKPIPMSGGSYDGVVKIPVAMVDFDCATKMQQCSVENWCVVRFKSSAESATKSNIVCLFLILCLLLYSL
ncbi:hypothetical protein QR680_007144 [Steinernema hermaphroditum]|uniref:Uncharacterized protein n=1 Tax=Steinernema hermaphroditum TaxID=289476 RepID=A0AA39LYM2_9BILA|nr:hypothetical protein QR680_007144 [Steinernema hermaphroditum]